MKRGARVLIGCALIAALAGSGAWSCGRAGRPLRTPPAPPEPPAATAPAPGTPAEPAAQPDFDLQVPNLSVPGVDAEDDGEGD